MNGYHVNPDTGRAGKCHARIKCKFGIPDNEHFETKEEAKVFHEKEKAKENPEALEGTRRISENGDERKRRGRKPKSEEESQSSEPQKIENTELHSTDNYADDPDPEELEEIDLEDSDIYPDGRDGSNCDICGESKRSVKYIQNPYAKIIHDEIEFGYYCAECYDDLVDSI